VAYRIYKDVIRFDVKNQAITLELLKLARNPMALVKQGIQLEDEDMKGGLSALRAARMNGN
jgi:hypothetical protein